MMHPSAKQACPFPVIGLHPRVVDNEGPSSLTAHVFFIVFLPAFCFLLVFYWNTYDRAAIYFWNSRSVQRSCSLLMTSASAFRFPCRRTSMHGIILELFPMLVQVLSGIHVDEHLLFCVGDVIDLVYIYTTYTHTHWHTRRLHIILHLASKVILIVGCFN